MRTTLFRPAPFIDPLPEPDASRVYPSWRMRQLAAIFAGYAGYYLVRSNFAFAKPLLMSSLHLGKSEVGLIASALAATYGVSKFVMGNLADRSNARTFLAAGLIGSGLVNLAFGSLVPLWPLIAAWAVNGWFQGMGWGPCARTMTHWFSDRERGTYMGIWNTAHNLGGALAGPLATMSLALFSTAASIFFVPGAIAVMLGVTLLAVLVDTPQSVGLPPIEAYRNDYPPCEVEDREREMSAREILLDHVLNQRTLWILALANLGVYVVRFGVINWAPTYLPEVKHYVASSSRWQSLIFELGGIPGMLASGWVSDRFFAGRRAPVSVVLMAVVTAGVLVYWKTPAGHPIIDALSLFCVGFAIYGPVMLIGVAAVDCVPKKAAATAAGFTGLFGYIGTVGAEAGIGHIVDAYGWDAGFSVITACGVVSALLLSLLWHAHDRRRFGDAPH